MSDSGTKQQEGRVCRCTGWRGWFIVGQTMICNWCKSKIEEEPEDDKND